MVEAPDERLSGRILKVNGILLRELSYFGYLTIFETAIEP